jgi:PAS domain-containing protein
MEHSIDNRSAQSLPEDLYVCTVDALYSDARSLFIGATSAAMAAAFTASKSGDWTLLACAIALFAIGLVRVFDMHAYARTGPKPLTGAQARRWEVRYMVGSCAVYAVLGAWGFLAFTRTVDSTVHLISFSVIIAYMVGITGRNFSNDMIVTSQTVLVAVPMIAALLLQATMPHTFLAILLLPFFLSIRFISARLRRTLFDAVEGAQEVRSLAERFDTALNNMPHGLAMFDADHRLVVCNGQFNDVLLLPGRTDRRGMETDRLFDECVTRGGLVPAHVEILSDAFEEIRKGAEPTTSRSRRRTDARSNSASEPWRPGGSFSWSRT